MADRGHACLLAAMPHIEPKKHKILLVEDDAPIAELVQMHLHEEGLDVTHAPSGDLGAELLARGHWDAMVLDLMLPGLDGLEICRRARAMAHYLPIIMVSARGSEVQRVLGLALGADDYCPSPSRCWNCAPV